MCVCYNRIQQQYQFLLDIIKMMDSATKLHPNKMGDEGRGAGDNKKGRLTKSQFLLSHNCFQVNQILNYYFDKLMQLASIMKGDPSLEKTNILSKRMRNIFDRFPEFEGLGTDKSYLENLFSHYIETSEFSVFFPCSVKAHVYQLQSLNLEERTARLNLRFEIIVKIPENMRNMRSFVQQLISKMQITILRQSQQTKVGFNDLSNDRNEEKLQVWTSLLNYYRQNNEGFRDHNIEEKLQGYKALLFVIDKEVSAQIQNYSFLSPFELTDLIVSLNIPPVVLDWSDLSPRHLQSTHKFEIKCRFNIVDVNQGAHAGQSDQQITFEDQVSLGAHDLAESILFAEVSNNINPKRKLKNKICNWKWNEERQNQQSKGPKQKIEQQRNQPAKKQRQSVRGGGPGKKYIKTGEKPSPKDSTNKLGHIYTGDSFCHLHFPFYLKPEQPLVMIFVPLGVLGLINLIIFFQQASGENYGDRIANMAALLISFIGMIVVVRDQIKSDTLTIVTFLTFMMITTPLLCAVQTFVIFLTDQSDEKPDPLKSALFWISVIFTAINILYPLGMYLIYRVFLLPKYNMGSSSQCNLVLPKEKNEGRNIGDQKVKLLMEDESEHEDDKINSVKKELKDKREAIVEKLLNNENQKPNKQGEDGEYNRKYIGKKSNFEQAIEQQIDEMKKQLMVKVSKRQEEEKQMQKNKEYGKMLFKGCLRLLKNLKFAQKINRYCSKKKEQEEKEAEEEKGKEESESEDLDSDISSFGLDYDDIDLDLDDLDLDSSSSEKQEPHHEENRFNTESNPSQHQAK